MGNMSFTSLIQLLGINDVAKMCENCDTEINISFRNICLLKITQSFVEVKNVRWTKSTVSVSAKQGKSTIRSDQIMRYTSTSRTLHEHSS